MKINLGNIGKRLGVAAALVNEDLAEKFIRSWLISKLNKLTLDDLDYAVKNNYDLWDNSSQGDRKMGYDLIKEYKEVYKKYHKMLNSDKIMEWLREDRKDFWEYIMNDSTGKARNWLDGMVDKIHMRIWEQVNSDPDINLRKGDKK